MPSGDSPRLARRRSRSADDRCASGRAAGRRSSSGIAHASFSLVRRQEVERVDAHRAGVVDAVSRAGLPARTTHCAPASRSAATSVGAPLGVGRVGAGQADHRLRRRSAASTSSTSRSAPATSTAMPPAANRLVANVARAVCAATVPIVARKTGAVGGLVAQRLERRAVAAHGVAALGVRRPLGQRLGEVRELAEPGERALAGGDLRGRARRDRGDPRRSVVERLERSTGRPRSGRSSLPARRRRGRR